MNRYLCYVIGEDKDRMDKLLPITRRRYTASALAIHLPVLMWAVNGYFITHLLFGQGVEVSALIGLICATTIYCLERVILVTGKSWWMACLRIFLGVCVALIGAFGMDLIIFDREVQQQIKADAVALLDQREEEYAAKDKLRAASVEKLRLSWLDAQAKAACEGNGTCGSKKQSVGPLYRALKENEREARVDYDKAAVARQRAQEAHEADMVEAKASSQKPSDAGLLARIKALHSFIDTDPYASNAYHLILALLLALELMVIAVKMLSPETADDKMEHLQADDRARRAQEYFANLQNPSTALDKTVKSALSSTFT